MTAADRVIRWSTALAVVGVAAVAAVASDEHAYDLVRAHGEAGWTARLVPLTVDGLVYASSMEMLDSARRGTQAGGEQEIFALAGGPAVPRFAPTCTLVHRRRAQSTHSHDPDRVCSSAADRDVSL